MGSAWKRLMTAGIIGLLLLRPLGAAAVESEVQINVGELGQKSASFAVGERHKWYIRCALPEAWEAYSGFTVLQTLSPALTLETDTMGVRLVMNNGEQILLRMEEHYQLTAGSVFVEEGTADRICISLTPEGITFLSGYQPQASELLISYTARINTGAAMGTQILGTAQRNLTERGGKKIIVLSDKAAAATGGFHIRLTDPSGKPVAGGQFMLAREASERERSDPEVLTELLDTGEETIVAVYERFYTSEAMEGEKTDRAVTDEEGLAVCYGLCYGTYYLVQTESPREELLSAKPVAVTVDEASHLTEEDGWKDTAGRTVDNTVRVAASTLVMPQTGGFGMLPYTASGTAVILCACILLWNNRKRKVPV